ncbi:MAG TPA: cell envelope biogenesis protein OmpA [Halieaceae bacterium]|nr:cell envelope biogenesis protein OmpA [Halieaceae bacterium]
MRPSTAGALALCAILTACQTTDPYTGETKTSNATKGAAAGAVAGALIGAISGDNNRQKRKRAAVGAGIGALAGAGVGSYMDREEAALRERLAGTGVSVSRVGDEIVLNMPGNITFETNAAAISAEFYPVLDSVATVVNEYEKTLVEVVGHTDSTGSDAINQPLSEQRADSVAAYLASRGVLPQRIATAGLGSRQPVASNATAEGRAQNRRVEITLAPITG